MNAVEIQGLTYTYPRGTEPALKELDLTIPRGQFCAIVGANGAGKSTLCYALAGFVPHFYRGELQGSVRVGGHDVLETPLAQLAGEVGLVFANPFNQITGARFTVAEEIAFGLENLGVPRQEMLARIGETLELTGLEGLADRSPFALSGGQQQRLAIASVIAMQPPVLVLDEPTSQLDPAGSREIFALLDALTAGRETSVIVAEHKLEWLAVHADRVIALANGRIIADGPPRQVLTSLEVWSAGITPTHYTAAAHEARQAGLMPNEGTLPVTLEEAVAFFRE